MKHLISFNFPGTGYSSHLFFSDHSGDDLIELARKTWNSVGGCHFPFQQGRGVERKITSQETDVLRKLFSDRVTGYKPLGPDDPDFNPSEDSLIEYEEYVKNGNQWNDVVFRELANIGHNWDGRFIIEMIFDLARIGDPTVKYQKINLTSSVDLF